MSDAPQPAEQTGGSGLRRGLRLGGRGRGWAPFAVLAVSLLATALTARFIATATAEVDRLHFQDASSSVLRSVAERMETYGVALEAGVGLFAAADGKISAQRFESFIRRFGIEQRHPGIQGFGYTATVRPGEREALEARLREQGYEGFRIWPDGHRETYQPVTYLFPQDARNRAALGYDMLSEETRAKAMRRARDTGQPTLSGPVVLVQEIDENVQTGMLLYSPVYRPGAPTGTVDERRAGLAGFVYAPFRTTDLFEGIFARQPSPYVAFSVYDGEPLPENLLYRSSDWRQAPPDPDLRLVQPLEVPGRSWTLVFRPTQAFVETSNTLLVPLTAGFGVFLSLALFSLVLLETRARSRAIEVALELQRSENRLRDANRAKDEFVAMLGHELRNPLAATRSALEVLRLSDLRDADALAALEAAERQMLRQKHLVDDLLDMSRVSRGKIALRRQNVDLRTVVKEAVETVRASAARRNQKLEVVLPPAGVTVDGDPTRLVQIVQNLLTNAIKYTPEGGEVTASAALEGEEAVVRVRDNGVGIEAEALEHIFDLFAQVETNLARSTGGLGIGLTLSRRLVELHGGTLHAHSDGAHLGSEFVVRLPKAESLGPRVTPNVYFGREPEEDEKPLCVLIVEDNEDARSLSERLLRKWGHDVVSAEDGERGVAMALEQRPDIALVDIGLPQMDGFEVARRIRAEIPHDELMLVAVSGYGRDEDRRKSADAGFDRHLTKPVEPRELRQLLGEVRRAGPRRDLPEGAAAAR